MSNDPIYDGFVVGGWTNMEAANQDVDKGRVGQIMALPPEGNDWHGFPRVEWLGGGSGYYATSVLRASTAPAMFAIKVETSPDSNGNPRRGWLVYQRPGHGLGFVEEGYAGDRALTMAHPEFAAGMIPGNVIGHSAPAQVTCVLEVTGGEWRRILKAQKQRDQEAKKVKS